MLIDLWLVYDVLTKNTKGLEKDMLAEYLVF